MKFFVDNQLLKNRLEEIKKIMPENPIIPIEEYVMFIYKENTLTIKANGRAMELMTDLVVEGDQEAFSTCVRIDVLVKTISLFKNKDTFFEFSTDGQLHTLEMKSGKGSAFKLSCEDPISYPTMKVGECSSKLRVDAAYMKTAFATAFSFVETNDNSLMMMPGSAGINIDVVEGGQYIRVTSASKVSGCRIQFYGEDIVTSWEPVLIPALFGEIVAKTIADMETVTMQHDGRVLHIPGVLFDIKVLLLETKFPNMNSIFAQQNTCVSASIDRDDLVRAIKRLRNYNDKNRDLFMDIKEDHIYMSASSALYGNEGEEKLFVDMPKAMPIGMNIHAVINVLSKIDSPNIRFYYHSPKIAFFVTPDIDDSSVYKSQFIIMPFFVLGK